MIENTPYNDPFDKYLLGKLSAEEMAAMDAELATNSQLQEDMLLQQDIVHALQDERRLELKSRLNSLEVGAGGFSSAVGLKIAAGIALLGIIGSGIYFYADEPKTDAENALPVGIIDFPQTSEAIRYSIPEIPEASARALTVAPRVAKEESSTSAETRDRRPATSTATIKVSPVQEQHQRLALEQNTGIARPQVKIQKPKVLSDFKETDITSNAQHVETPVDAMARNQQFTTQSIEVTAQAHDKWNFHYRFFDSKLFIYGEFNNKPYEILEINTEGTTSYYLYFENSYYGLRGDQQKLTKLKKLTNDKLIRELDITRNQKLNP